jgi:ATP-dependent helicase/nuclease subunit B
LLPDRISVSAHRHLIDCPYKFFATSGLQLRPREEIREAFEKAEYGQLVHRALELFHKGNDAWPGPFTGPVTAANRLQAIALLEQISDSIFSRELEDNFEHRAWLRRWRVLIPGYIDWQIQHQVEWRFSDAELDGSVELAGASCMVDWTASTAARQVPTFWITKPALCPDRRRLTAARKCSCLPMPC